MKRLILTSIRFYQRTVSPDHSAHGRRRYPYGYCLYQPTCSEYAYQAINDHGVVMGISLAARRVLRCNPWSQGGLDPVPPKAR